MSSQTRRTLAFTALFALLWLGLVSLRPWVIHTVCITSPEQCTNLTVPWIDRAVIANDNSFGEDLSTSLQTVSGILAVLVPFAYVLGARAFSQKPEAFAEIGGPGAAVALTQTPLRQTLAQAATDVLRITQVVTLTGVLTETARLAIQRPRPYVYRDPAFYGRDLQNYTSFFSGHASFVTAANVALALTLAQRRAPLAVQGLSWLSALTLILATAWGRVAAGKHFITDVTVGTLVGATVAIYLISMPSLISYRRKRLLAASSPTQSS